VREECGDQGRYGENQVHAVNVAGCIPHVNIKFLISCIILFFLGFQSDMEPFDPDLTPIKNRDPMGIAVQKLP
jgi:hypothetical protein